MITLLIFGLIKKILYESESIFPTPNRAFGGNVKVEIDLSSCATKLELKKATGIDTSNFTLKSNLTSLKTEVDKINVDKLKTVPVDLSKLRNVVNDGVVKKTVYDKLVAKGNNIDTSGFVLKTKYNTDKSDLEKKVSDADKKIPDTSGLVKKTDLNTKTTEIENKIPSISGLATNAALNAVENKIPDVSSLVKQQIRTQKLVKSKSKSLVMVMINTLLLQNLTS